jgi:tetratricopeptide (TPR) repeat protein
MREWLGVAASDYCGERTENPSAEQVATFSEWVVTHMEDSTPKDADHLTDLLEELVGMNVPLLAMKLADAYPHLFPHDDFRANLHLGNAAMLVGDLAKAEIAFMTAQKIVPEEPAPYINLTQIYCHDGALKQAKDWCLAGLDAESDNTRLWELLAWIEQTAPGSSHESTAKAIADHAKTLNSWAGTSLACDLLNAEDPLTKLAALETFWDEGLRDEEFLIEWTAVLGMAGRYDRIPAIVWQAEKAASNQLPWQLMAHLAQSYLGLGRDAEALTTLDKLLRFKGLPDVAHQSIQAMQLEIKNSSVSH